MYKFRKRSIQMIHFNEVFANQITVKQVGIGLITLISILLIIAAALVVFTNYEKSLAANEKKLVPIVTSSGEVKNIASNDIAEWECYPRDMSCYTKYNDLGPCQFQLLVKTVYGDAIGLADCMSPGLCAPGNRDIRGSSRGVEGDSHGSCNITYEGFWMEESDGFGYHHWSVNNYGLETTPEYQSWVGEFKVLAKGGVCVDKKSTWIQTKYFSEYSFEGCTYDAYLSLADAQNRQNIYFSIVLDKSGHGETSLNLPSLQKLYIRESNKPGKHGVGYHYNDDIGYVEVQPGTATKIQWGDGSNTTSDEPYLTDLSLGLIKTDFQTKEAGVTEGSVESFANAHYEFSYHLNFYESPSNNLNTIMCDYLWVMATDENGQVAISEKYRNNKVDGDVFIEHDGKIVLPLGTCFIHEVKAPDGYLISDKMYRVRMSYNENVESKIETTVVDVSTGEHLQEIIDPQYPDTPFKFKEQIIRGDYKFIKVNDREETLSGIPFKITSQTTGEWHICVSDEDGIIDTSNSHFKHSNATNYNDAFYDEESNTITDEDALMSNCGVWFAYNKKTGDIGDVDDSLGALPYDSYTIEEIPISANQKYLPFESRTFIVNEHGYLIEGPDWVNKEPFIPPIIPPIVPASNIMPQTGDVSLWIIGIPILAVLCYIMRRWVCYRKY